MARRIFWSVFSLVLLYVGVTFGNVSSSRSIEEALREMGGNDMPIRPCAQELVAFFNTQRRWPTADEVVLLQPGADRFGWGSTCVGVSPHAVASVIYRHCGDTALAEVEELQQSAIALHDGDRPENR